MRRRLAAVAAAALVVAATPVEPKGPLPFQEALWGLEASLPSLALAWRSLCVQREAAAALGARATPDVGAGLLTASLRTGVPRSLLLAVMEMESGGDRWALSRRNAVGLMQVRRVPWEAALGGGEADWYDPLWNIHAGAEVLRRLGAQHGSWHLALAHYHSGRAAFESAYAERVLRRWSQLRAVEEC